MKRVKLTTSLLLLLILITSVSTSFMTPKIYAQDTGTAVNYPPGAATDYDKLVSVYSLIEQMRLEHNRVGNVALKDWKTYGGKWRTYCKLSDQYILPLLVEQYEIKQRIRKISYSDKSWDLLHLDLKVDFWESALGDEANLKTQPTQATSDSLDRLKAIKLDELKETAPGVDPNEDFSSPNYTEDDTLDRLTISPNTKITGAQVEWDDLTVIYKDFGVDHFNALNVYSEILVATGTSQDRGYGGHGFTVSVVDHGVHLWGSYDPWICIRWDSTNGAYLGLVRGNFAAEDWWTGAALDTPYYLHTERAADSATITVKVYASEADRITDTNRIDTLSISGFGTTTKYRYHYGFANLEWAGIQRPWYGYIANIDLHEEGGVTVPTLTTNAASSVEETTATLSGDITATGGENADERGFEWDIDSGTPYSSNWTEEGDYGTGEFTHGITGLTQGELYYYRAMAENSEGWGYGSEVTFLNKPDEPTGLTSPSQGTTWISLSWSTGTGSQKTMIRYRTDGTYPTGLSDGTQAYFDTGSTCNVSGLNPGTEHKFRSWSYATEGGLEQYSDATSDLTESTVGINTPTVVTNVASSVEETTTTLSGNITATGGEDCTRLFEWDTDSGAPYSSNWTDAGTHGIGNYTHGLTGLDKGEGYYYRATANNTAGYGYGDEAFFITKPDPATDFASTDNGTTWLSLSWTNGTGMDYVEIRYSDSSYPTDNTSGSLGYWGSSTTANVTGLIADTTYYFSLFTHATENSQWSTADTYATCSDKTDAEIGIPSVTTGAASSVEETTATLNGNITDTGGENATERGFEWDTDSGTPYSSNWTAEGDFGTGAFNHGITGLTKGEIYYYRAMAQNSDGWGYGSEVTFLTKPDEPTGLGETDVGTTWIEMEWVKGTGAQKTMVRYKLGSYPTSISDGTQAYFNTGTSVNVTSLDPNVIYYFRSWSYVTEGDLEQYSDSTNDDTAVTDVDLPTVTNSTGASNITDDSARLNGNVTDNGGENPTVTAYWGESDGGTTPGSWDYYSVLGAKSEGTFYYDVTDNLTPETLYYYRMRAVNTGGTDWADISANFTTTETGLESPTGLMLTDLGCVTVTANWTKGDNSTYTMIRVSRSEYPETPEGGELAYYGDAESCNITGLSLDVSMFFFLHGASGQIISHIQKMPRKPRLEVMGC